MNQTPKNTLKSAVWALTQAKKITHTAHKVLMQLVGHVHGNACYPSLTTLAAEAGCSVRSVIRAINAAEALGFVVRSTRMVKKGLRGVRTSNAYSFCLDRIQQARNAAQAVFEAAQRAAKAARGRYYAYVRGASAFKAVSDKEASNPETPYIQKPLRSHDELLKSIAAWDEEYRINRL